MNNPQNHKKSTLNCLARTLFTHNLTVKFFKVQTLIKNTTGHRYGTVELTFKFVLTVLGLLLSLRVQLFQNIL